MATTKKQEKGLSGLINKPLKLTHKYRDDILEGVMLSIDSNFIEVKANERVIYWNLLNVDAIEEVIN